MYLSCGFKTTRRFFLLTSVNTEMCCPKGKCGCQYFILLTLKKKIMGTWVMDFFNKGRSPFNGRLSDFSSYIDSQISVHRKFKKIDQLISRNAKEIYLNEKFPIL